MKKRTEFWKKVSKELEPENERLTKLLKKKKMDVAESFFLFLFYSTAVIIVVGYLTMSSLIFLLHGIVR